MNTNTRIKIIALIAVAIVIIFIIMRTHTRAPESAGDNLSKTYSNSAIGFSLRYPEGYAVDESYKYEALGPGKDIMGIKFSIPASVAAGTNLGADSYISVEKIPETSECSAALFVDQGGEAKMVTDNGVSYSFAISNGAGAGNRYDETVYAFPGTNPCVAVRYFIHYSVFENYPEGAVRRFDEQMLTSQFDQIRRTLTLKK